MSEYTDHVTVLKNQACDFLTEKKGSVFADLTFGGGGHSRGILERCPKAKIIAVDQDLEAVENGKNKFNSEVSLVHLNFSNFGDYIQENEPEIFNRGFDGILLDIGVSNHHFEKANRGFSFLKDGPLDMRMNQNDFSLKTAKEIVNNYSEKNLADIIYKYGEERASRKIAKKIVEEREKKVIETTSDLENIIFHSFPPKERHKKIHPATRTFQALRIYINKELEVLEQNIPVFFSLLNPGGRLVIITFHSLEDRIVKHSFKDLADVGDILTKKPVIPSKDELMHNSKARSAKLRVIEKI